MADTTYSIDSGFWNAVSNDRVYSADDMSMPYKHIASEGVYKGSFKVSTATGMKVSVAAGGGLYRGRWVELSSAQEVTVADNSSGNPRIDSIFVQVNENDRDAKIVYRTGTPAGSPVHPAATQGGGVYEWRLADIRVNSGVTSITKSNITDTRVAAILSAGSETGTLAVKSGTYNDLNTVLIANGDVVVVNVEFNQTSNLVLSFPAGFEPHGGYPTAGQQFFYTAIDGNNAVHAAELSYDLLGQSWEIVLPDVTATSYLSFTYIRA